MDDSVIIDLYWQRSQDAITETSRKYGHYCNSIAYNILANPEDAEECVNDTWLRAWNAMPPQRPNRLGAWLAKITRNLSLNRIAARNTEKRGSGEIPLALHELEDCIPAAGGVDIEAESGEAEIIRTLNDFLRNCRKREREIFLRRYWHLDSIERIAKQYGLKETNVTTILYRMRLKLKDQFDRKGIAL